MALKWVWPWEWGTKKDPKSSHYDPNWGNPIEDAASQLKDVDFEGLYTGAAQKASDIYGTTGQTSGAWGSQGAAKMAEMPTYTEWLQQKGIDPSQDYAGMQGLIDQLSQGPTAADAQAAQGISAGMYGMDPTEFTNLLGSLAGQQEGGPAGQQGFSPQERALRERANRSNVRQAEQRAQRLVQNTLADTRSTARMLMQADEATGAINNLQLQQDAQLAQEEFERQVVQYNAKMQQLDRMVQSQQITYQQYIGAKQTGLSQALEGYAAKITSRTQEYGADAGAIADQADYLYKMATLQLGIDKATLDATEQLYSQSVQPIMDSINALLTAGELTEADWSEIVSLIVDAGSTIASLAA